MKHLKSCAIKSNAMVMKNMMRGTNNGKVQARVLRATCATHTSSPMSCESRSKNKKDFARSFKNSDVELSKETWCLTWVDTEY